MSRQKKAWWVHYGCPPVKPSCDVKGTKIANYDPYQFDMALRFYSIDCNFVYLEANSYSLLLFFSRLFFVGVGNY